MRAVCEYIEVQPKDGKSLSDLIVAGIEEVSHDSRVDEDSDKGWKGNLQHRNAAYPIDEANLHPAVSRLCRLGVSLTY